MIFRRKKSNPDREYRVDEFPFIIERVQLPHSLTLEDGSHYKVATISWSLRVKDGPMMFERRYVVGKEEDIQAHKKIGLLIEHISANDALMTRQLFYNSLYDNLMRQW